MAFPLLLATAPRPSGNRWPPGAQQGHPTNPAAGFGSSGATGPEAEGLAVIKRLVKSREDSVAQFEKVGQIERANQERAEIEYLKPYLPAMLEGAELEAAVKEAIAQTGATSKKDLGLVMKALQAAHGGAYDGKLASGLVQTLLG